MESSWKVLHYRNVILFPQSMVIFNAAIFHTYIPRRGNEIAFGSDSSSNSNFLVWSIVKYLKILTFKFNKRTTSIYSSTSKEISFTYWSRVKPEETYEVSIGSVWEQTWFWKSESHFFLCVQIKIMRRKIIPLFSKNCLDIEPNSSNSFIHAEAF